MSPPERAEPGSPGSLGSPGDRRAQLAAALEVVRDRITVAAARAGRSPEEITLIAVTKTYPASDVAHLAALGIADVGENRDQEAAAKHAACVEMGLLGARALRWHFVGQLQTNKARSVASYADVVHSVDRRRLVTALGRAAQGTGRELTCLVQVDVTHHDGHAGPAMHNGYDGPAMRDMRDGHNGYDGHDGTGVGSRHGPGRPDGGQAPGRGGAAPSEVRAIADAVAVTPGLRLGGVMAVAGLGQDPVEAFARLREVADRVRADHPEATMISAGMSGDLEAAIAAGATHLRVGAALLGHRPPLG